MLSGADGDRWEKGLLDLHASHGALQVGDVRLHRFLANVLQWPDAVELAPPDARGRGPLRREVLGEVLALAIADRTCYRGPGLNTRQPLAHVGGEARLRLLAIRDDVEPVLRLLLHHLRHVSSVCKAGAS